MKSRSFFAELNRKYAGRKTLIDDKDSKNEDDQPRKTTKKKTVKRNMARYQARVSRRKNRRS